MELKDMVCNNGKRKASILKHADFVVSIKRCFAKYISLCYNNIRISIQKGTTSKLRLQRFGLGVIASTTSIIILSGFPNIVRRSWWVE